jgi:hypothetical protein
MSSKLFESAAGVFTEAMHLSTLAAAFFKPMRILIQNWRRFQYFFSTNPFCMAVLSQGPSPEKSKNLFTNPAGSTIQKFCRAHAKRCSAGQPNDPYEGDCPFAVCYRFTCIFGFTGRFGDLAPGKGCRARAGGDHPV